MPNSMVGTKSSVERQSRSGPFVPVRLTLAPPALLVQKQSRAKRPLRSALPFRLTPSAGTHVPCLTGNTHRKPEDRRGVARRQGPISPALILGRGQSEVRRNTDDAAPFPGRGHSRRARKGGIPSREVGGESRFAVNCRATGCGSDFSGGFRPAVQRARAAQAGERPSDTRSRDGTASVLLGR